MSGCCAGHPCDDCRTCKSGRCCRKDNPVYVLPEPGDWTGPVRGEVGSLSEVPAGGLQCHICGEAYDNLGSHVALAHDVTPHEYRAYFQLKRTLALRSARMLAKHSEAYARMKLRDPEHASRALQGLRAFQEAWTAEQRSETFAGRRERVQARRSRPSPKACTAGHSKTAGNGVQRPDGKGWRCYICDRQRKASRRLDRA